MIRHIVMFQLKRPEDAPKVKALLDSCKGLVPGMHEFDVGIKTEGLEATADVVLVSTFADAAAMIEQCGHDLVPGPIGATVATAIGLAMAGPAWSQAAPTTPPYR